MGREERTARHARYRVAAEGEAILQARAGVHEARPTGTRRRTNRSSQAGREESDQASGPRWRRRTSTGSRPGRRSSTGSRPSRNGSSAPRPMSRTTASIVISKVRPRPAASLARTRRRSSGEGEPGDTRVHHVRGAPSRGLPLRERIESAGHQEGRSRLSLHAHGAGACDRDARLHANRCTAFDRVRGLLGGGAARSDQRRRGQARRDGGRRLSQGRSPSRLKATVDRRRRERRLPSRRSSSSSGRSNPSRFGAGRDVWWHEAMAEGRQAKSVSRRSSMRNIRSSSSTRAARRARPKGILHTTGGYLTHVTTTFKAIFDIKDEDVYWCTADIGWITGHSATWSTVRSRMARRPSCTKARRRTPAPIDGGP